MIVTMDTNVVANACVPSNLDHMQILLELRSGPHTIALDQDNRILGEYRKNCKGKEFFETWLVEIFRRCKFQYLPGKLDKSHVDRLKKLGCHEPSDHVFVAVAMKGGRYIITDDSDFTKARAILEQLGLTVHGTKQALEYLPKTP